MPRTITDLVPPAMTKPAMSTLLPVPMLARAERADSLPSEPAATVTVAAADEVVAPDVLVILTV